MNADIAEIDSTQRLVDLFVQAHNKFWFIEDDICDYEEGFYKADEENPKSIEKMTPFMKKRLYKAPIQSA